MKYVKLAFAFVLIALLSQCVTTNTQPFTFSADLVPVGKTLIYHKSNLDGTNSGSIAVYYKSTNTIESFKWHDNNNRATKIRAELDMNSLNVSQFEALRVNADGTEKTTAVLTTLEEGIFNIKFDDNETITTLGETSWHSYDFDFASLGYTFKFINNKKDTTEFDIFDLDLMQDPPEFKNFGSVQLVFKEIEQYAGVQALKYSIDGAGLDNRGGNIWFSENEGDLLGFEIKKPDEPGYESGKLMLVDVKTMSEKEWSDFQKNALN